MPLLPSGKRPVREAAPPDPFLSGILARTEPEPEPEPEVAPAPVEDAMARLARLRQEQEEAAKPPEPTRFEPTKRVKRTSPLEDTYVPATHRRAHVAMVRLHIASEELRTIEVCFGDVEGVNSSRIAEIRRELMAMAEVPYLLLKMDKESGEYGIRDRLPQIQTPSE